MGKTKGTPVREEPGKRKLSKAQRTKYRQILERLRSELIDQIRTLSSASSMSSKQAGEELADVASDDFIRETELTLMTEEGRRIELIDDALKRIEEGTYGICEDCDGQIGTARLEAKPFASLCVGCKEAREQNGGLPPGNYS